MGRTLNLDGQLSTYDIVRMEEQSPKDLEGRVRRLHKVPTTTLGEWELPPVGP